MKNKTKNSILKAVKNVAINENSKSIEGWPPCTSILYQPKRRKEK